MAFHETRFPTNVSLGSSGGPERRTDVVVLGSGHEERNSRWQDSRRRFNAGYGVRSVDDLHQVIAFFEERRGRLHGFRYKDWSDYKSSPPSATPTALDQAIGTGDGATLSFQLTKAYGASFLPWSRNISKPVSGSVVVAVDSTEQVEEIDFVLDPTTGTVSFLPGHVPASGAAITAGFEFDVPARFDTDFLNINMGRFEAGDIPDIPIVELRI